jgi:hypothetical protein
MSESLALEESSRKVPGIGREEDDPVLKSDEMLCNEA